MKKIVWTSFALTALALAIVGRADPKAQGDPGELAMTQLKTMVENLGYETKELNNETGKFEFKISRDGLDIPIALELSSSKRYVWLSVFFGEFEKLSGPHERAVKLLKENFKVQPCQFYVTDKGSLMLALPIDNRGINPAVLRRCVDKVSTDVANTRALWGEQVLP